MIAVFVVGTILLLSRPFLLLATSFYWLTKCGEADKDTVLRYLERKLTCGGSGHLARRHENEAAHYLPPWVRHSQEIGYMGSQIPQWYEMSMTPASSRYQ